jgi:transposase InsO family protein
MPWRTMDVRDQRVRFVIEASREVANLAELCREFGVSRPTGYRWLRRYQAHGVDGLCEYSRRPRVVSGRTPREVEEQIVELRRRRPDWGARKLQVLLQRRGLEMPVVTIHRVLLRRGLVRAQDQHRPALQRFEREAPNQLWQMDFKSPKGWNQAIGPLSVLDDCSRFALLLQGTWTTRGEAVQEQLEGVFQRYGVPAEMLMDHGIPWWNGQGPRGWTRLTVWLMKQGVGLRFSGVRHPQTQGKVERFHGTLEQARRRRGLPVAELHQAWLDEFREEYNQVRPHEALGMKTPASVWSPSSRSYNPNPPEWEYGSGSEVQRLGPHGQLKLGGRWWQVCEALAGEAVRLERVFGRVLVHYCQTLVREIDLVEQRSAAFPPSLRSVGKAVDLQTCKGCGDNVL